MSNMQNTISKVYKATYNGSDVRFKENPLIEALPSIKGDIEFLKWAIQLPNYSESERELDKATRVSLVNSLRNSFFIPTGRHYQLYSNLHNCLFNSYKYRNPTLRGYKISLNMDYRNLSSNNIDSNYELCNTPFGFSVIGLSGVGKTSAINQCLKSLPAALSHNIEGLSDFIQVPIIKIECPREGSLKQLCYKFFEALDSILGSDYSERYSGRKYGVDELVSKMAKVVIIHNIGCVIVDEIQQIKASKAGGAERLINFFVNLNNTLKVPVIFIGTPECLDVFQANLRQARRCEEFGSYHWDKVANDREWELFIKKLWKFQYTKKEFPFDESFKDAMYYHSQGIVDYAVRLFIRSQIRAISVGYEVINLELIQQVVNDEMSLEKPMIEALRSGDINRQRKYNDIWIPGKEIAEGFMKNTISEDEHIRAATIISKIIQVRNMSQDSAIKYANLYLEKFPNDSTSDLVIKILIAIQEEENMKQITSKVKSKGKLKKQYQENDLRELVADGIEQSNIYDNLKLSGYIKDPLQEFTI